MLERLSLSHFRSYSEATLETSAQMVVLTGDNGAGKTNILEAISLFSQGRGLRRASMEEMRREGSSLGFSINIKLGDDLLGTGSEASSTSRLARLNGQDTSISQFSELIRIIWLTPQMDGLFLGAAGERRKFLDRLVLAVDHAHGSRVNALERLLRSRNKLLEENGEKRWLDAIEKELAEIAIAVAVARAETIARLNGIIALEEHSLFPKAKLSFFGFYEENALNMPSIDLEETYRKTLFESRYRDKAAGRTLDGPHRSDLIVHHTDTGDLAERCSTGQQKALLIGMILSQAELISQMAGFPPVILLDETVAHLDVKRRSALFNSLAKLKAQVWMTGADMAAFDELKGRADQFEIALGTINLL